MDNNEDFLFLLTEQQKKQIYENFKTFEKIYRDYESCLKYDEPEQTNHILSYYINLCKAYPSLSKTPDLKHELFVKYCLAPKGYITDNGEVFASVIGTEKVNEKNYVNISVITPSMAFIDSLYFSSDNDEERNYDNARNIDNNNIDSYLLNNKFWTKEYRPYYYEFTSVLSDEELKLFFKQIGKLKKESNYKKEDCFWFKAKLVKESQNISGNYFGILNFGGSESFSEGLVFTSLETVDDATSKLLDSIYNISFSPNEPDCINFLNQYFNSFSQFRVKVYNVGQANCIYIEDKNSTKHFFFDIGRPLDSYQVNKHSIKNADLEPNTDVSKNLISIHSLKHDLIIVSHWHTDHFASFKDLNNNHGLKCAWILPKIDVKYDIKSASRLLKYLVKNHAKVYYLNSKGKIYDNNGIQLLTSTSKSRSDPNVRSLMLRIKDTLFSADSLYEFWPDDLTKNLSDIKHLVVPHHCSKKNKNIRGIQKSQNVINSFSKAPGKKAYISVGFNTYGHPDGSHKTALNNAGFAIKETSSTTDGYTFVIN